MKAFIENNLLLTFLTAAALGLILPGVDHTPKVTVLFLLGFVIFLSCQRINYHDISSINIKSAVSFYISRFILLPIALYYAAGHILPNFKDGILLMALMPAATAAPSLTGIINGNVALSLGVTIISGFLCPFVVPAIFHMIGYGDVEFNIVGMFITLASVIFIPVTLWFAVAKHSKNIVDAVDHHGKFTSILCISLIGLIVIGQQKDTLLSDPAYTIIALPVLFALFTLFFAFGWIWGWTSNKSIQNTYALNAGMMNSALAISIALLYFSPDILLFTVLSEVPWILAMPIFQFFIRKT